MGVLVVIFFMGWLAHHYVVHLVKPLFSLGVLSFLSVVFRISKLWDSYISATSFRVINWIS